MFSWLKFMSPAWSFSAMKFMDWTSRSTFVSPLAGLYFFLYTATCKFLDPCACCRESCAADGCNHIKSFLIVVIKYRSMSTLLTIHWRMVVTFGGGWCTQVLFEGPCVPTLSRLLDKAVYSIYALGVTAIKPACMYGRGPVNNMVTKWREATNLRPNLLCVDTPKNFPQFLIHLWPSDTSANRFADV